MAKNYIQPGDVLNLTAPYDRKSGEGAMIGAIFAVALVDVKAGEQASFGKEGVFELDKVASEVWAEGEKVFWDDAAKLASNAAGDLIGFVTEAAAAGSASGRVKLNEGVTP